MLVSCFSLHCFFRFFSLRCFFSLFFLAVRNFFGDDFVTQTDSIAPGRVLTLVRPGNDLVLQRIRYLKCCVQACGCIKTTPRYAVWARRAPKQNPGWVLAGFLAGWLGWLLASVFGRLFGWLGFWLGFWLAFGWVWLAFWLGLAGFLAGFWLGFWLAWTFFPWFFSSPCRNAAAGDFASVSRGRFVAATRLHAALDFESFAGRGRFLDGRVSEPSQVQ